MRPASYFSIIQLSNSRVFCKKSAVWNGEKSSKTSTCCWNFLENLPYNKRVLKLTVTLLNDIILSLTVDGRKNRCIPCICWAAAIFAVVTNYSNLFLPFTFFLDHSHFTFGYELVVCPETAGFMKVIRDFFSPIQWDESLLLYPGKIHRF